MAKTIFDNRTLTDIYKLTEQIKLTCNIHSGIFLCLFFGATQTSVKTSEVPYRFP